MKHLRFLKALIYGFSLLFLFSSCNSGTKSSEEKTTSDTTQADTSATMAAPTPAPSANPANALEIKHKVANFDKWKTAFESHDSIRNANGLHNILIGRGMDDPNMVIVVLEVDDVNKAKAFIASQDTKDRMKKAGVIGTSEMDFTNIVMNDTTKIDQNARLLSKSKVKDRDSWKKVFDSSTHKQARMDAGLIDRAIGYSIDDDHLVSIVFAVNDKKKADAFLKSKDLKDKMKESGVEGLPTFFYFNIVKMY